MDDLAVRLRDRGRQAGCGVTSAEASSVGVGSSEKLSENQGLTFCTLIALQEYSPLRPALADWVWVTDKLANTIVPKSSFVWPSAMSCSMTPPSCKNKLSGTQKKTRRPREGRAGTWSAHRHTFTTSPAASGPNSGSGGPRPFADFLYDLAICRPMPG